MREGLYYLMSADKLIRITHVDRLRSSVDNRYVVFSEYSKDDYGRWFVEQNEWESFKDDFYWIGRI